MERLVGEMTLAEMGLSLLKHKIKPLIIMKNIYFLIVFNNRAISEYLRVPISWRLRSDLAIKDICSVTQRLIYFLINSS